MQHFKFWRQQRPSIEAWITTVLKVLTFPGRNKLIPQPAHFRSQSGTLSCNGQQPGSQLAREKGVGGRVVVPALSLGGAASIFAGRLFYELCQQLQASTAFSMLHNIPVGELLLSGGVWRERSCTFEETRFVLFCC